MAILEQLKDATFLAQHGRYMTSLTTLLLAISASSRRTFPQGTKSRANPTKEMSDREAFTLFLGGRIRKILFGDWGGPDEGNSGVAVPFRGAQHDVAYILYKFYRCELVHDGELPEDVEFTSIRESGAGVNLCKQGMRVSIGAGNTMVLDHGWIDLLQEVVKNARCNGAEFGVVHFDLLPIPGIDETTVLASLVEKYETTPGRIQILKSVVRKLSPNAIADAADGTLTKHFNRLVETQHVNGGAISGLRSHNFTDNHGVLQKRGIELLRDIASSYHLVTVS